MEYWTGLPEEHHTALFQLRDEDFAAELDAHLKYQLRICKDCRGNVTRAFRWGACTQCLPSQRALLAAGCCAWPGLRALYPERRLVQESSTGIAVLKLHPGLSMLGLGDSLGCFH